VPVEIKDGTVACRWFIGGYFNHVAEEFALRLHEETGCVRETMISRSATTEKCDVVSGQRAPERSVLRMSIHSPDGDPSGRVRRVRHSIPESCRPVRRSTMMDLRMITGSDAVRNLR
jgi:hypothetical protein